MHFGFRFCAFAKLQTAAAGKKKNHERFPLLLTSADQRVVRITLRQKRSSVARCLYKRDDDEGCGGRRVTQQQRARRLVGVGWSRRKRERCVARNFSNGWPVREKNRGQYILGKEMKWKSRHR